MKLTDPEKLRQLLREEICVEGFHAWAVDECSREARGYFEAATCEKCHLQRSQYIVQIEDGETAPDDVEYDDLNVDYSKIQFEECST